MKLWKTQDMVQLIKEALKGHEFENIIKVSGAGGDYDTEAILVGEKEYEGFGKICALSVCGFHTEKTLCDNPSEAEIEMVELSDGLDSRGGLNSDDLPTCTAYGIISSALRKAGFDVVNTMDHYF